MLKNISPTKIFRRIIITLSIQLIIIIGLLEISLRFLEPYNHNLRVLLYNPYLLGQYEQFKTLEALLNTRPKGFKPYAKRAGFVLNSRSFKTKEYTSKKLEGYYRILVIGDSFTAGSGGVPYSQHWAVLLEKHLQSRVSDKIDVIKLGVGGVGPRFELRLWQLEGSKLEADLVILAFCIGNDFTDEREKAIPRSLSHFLIKNSYVFRLGRNLYRLKGVANSENILVSDQIDSNQNQRGGYEVTDYMYDSNKPTFERLAFLKVVANRMSITHKTEQARFIKLFTHLKPVLLFFRDSVKKNKARFVVIMIPDEYQIYPSLLKEAANSVGKQPKDYQIGLPQTQLSQFFQENQNSSKRN